MRISSIQTQANDNASCTEAIYGPNWSPDGQNIASTAGQKGTKEDIYSISTNGGKSARTQSTTIVANAGYVVKVAFSVRLRVVQPQISVKEVIHGHETRCRPQGFY